MMHIVHTRHLINDEREAEQTMMWIFAQYPTCIEKMLGLLPAKELGTALRRIMSPEALSELKESIK